MNLTKLVRSLATATVTFGLCAVLPAQSNSIEMRGQVEISLQGGCYYCPPISNYVIHGSETPIRSTTINLASYVGMDVKLSGTWTTSGSYPVVDVTGIQVVAPVLNISGNSRIGNTIRWIANGAPGDLAMHVLSLGASFVPLSGTTVFLLQPATMVVLGSGPIANNGSFQIDLPIPANSYLIGLHLFGQALIVPANSTTFYFSNPETKRIQ